MGRPIFSPKFLAAQSALSSSSASSSSLLDSATAQLSSSDPVPAVAKHAFEPQHSSPSRSTHLIDEHFLDPSSPTGRQITLRGLTLHLSSTARRLVLELPEELVNRAESFEESTEAGVVSLRVMDGRGEVVGVCSTRSEDGAERQGREWWPQGGRPQRSESAFETPSASRRVNPEVLEQELQAMVLRARTAASEQQGVEEGEVGVRRRAAGRRHPADIDGEAEAEILVEGLFAPEQQELGREVEAGEALFRQHSHPLLHSSSSPSSPPPSAPAPPPATTRLGDGWAEAARSEVLRRQALASNPHGRRHDGAADVAWARMQGEPELEDNGEGEVREARLERVGR